MAKLVTPALASARTPSALVSGWRWADQHLVAAHAADLVAARRPPPWPPPRRRSRRRWWRRRRCRPRRGRSARPRPASTTTSWPPCFTRRCTTSGTRATLRSPAALSFGTETFISGRESPQRGCARLMNGVFPRLAGVSLKLCRILFLEQPGKPGEQRLVVEGELDLAGAPRIEEWAERVLAAGRQAPDPRPDADHLHRLHGDPGAAAACTTWPTRRAASYVIVAEHTERAARVPDHRSRQDAGDQAAGPAPGDRQGPQGPTGQLGHPSAPGLAARPGGYTRRSRRARCRRLP